MGLDCRCNSKLFEDGIRKPFKTECYVALNKEMCELSKYGYFFGFCFKRTSEDLPNKCCREEVLNAIIYGSCLQSVCNLTFDL